MKRIVVLFLVFLIPLSFVFAQGMGMGNPEVRRQLEQIKIWQMTKEMDLPTEKAEKFFPLYNKYNDELKKITTERRQLVSGLGTALKDSVSDADMRNQIQQVIELDNQLVGAHRQFLQSLGQILTPTEIARYLVFEQKFQREIRDRIKMIMQQRMKGRPR